MIRAAAVAHASGGPRLTWPCARKIRSSSSGVGRGVPSGGSRRTAAGTDASRTMRSRPAGVLRTSTRALSLSTRNVCGTPIGTAAAPPAASTKRSSPASRRTRGTRRPRRRTMSRCRPRSASQRPEILVGSLAVPGGIVDSRRHDDQLSILLRVVPDAAPRPRWNADRLVLAQLDDVIPELELQPAGDHKVDLLLRPMPVPVRALAARVLRHAPIRDRDLFSADRVRDPAHLAGVIAQPVLDIL